MNSRTGNCDDAAISTAASYRVAIVGTCHFVDLHDNIALLHPLPCVSCLAAEARALGKNSQFSLSLTRWRTAELYLEEEGADGQARVKTRWQGAASASLPKRPSGSRLDNSGVRRVAECADL
jgi:hypothetical protein